MKKILSLLLTLALALSLTVTALAATVTGTGSESADVTASFKDNSNTPTVYSIDITWGSMEFTFNDWREEKWNADALEYETVGGVTVSYDSDAASNKVTVTNHSNVPIYLTDIELSVLDGYASDTFSLGGAVVTDHEYTEEKGHEIPAGPVNEPNGAYFLEYRVTPDGAPKNVESLNNTQIATITLTIS